MKKILILSIILSLSLAAAAESTPAEDFLENLGKTWDSFTVMVEDAAESAKQWAEESEVKSWFEGAGKTFTDWADTTLTDLQSWADDSGFRAWTEEVTRQAQQLLEENGPAVEAWLKKAGEEVTEAWNTLLDAAEHDKAQVEEALKTVTESLEGNKEN